MPGFPHSENKKADAEQCTSRLEVWICFFFFLFFLLFVYIGSH